MSNKLEFRSPLTVFWCRSLNQEIFSFRIISPFSFNLNSTWRHSGSTDASKSNKTPNHLPQIQTKITFPTNLPISGTLFSKIIIKKFNFLTEQIEIVKLFSNSVIANYIQLQRIDYIILNGVRLISIEVELLPWKLLIVEINFWFFDWYSFFCRNAAVRYMGLIWLLKIRAIRTPGKCLN